MKLDFTYDSLLVMCVLTSNEAPSPSGVEGSPIVIIDTNDRWNYDTARMEITPPLLLLSCWAVKVTATAAAIVLGSHSHRCCYRARQSQRITKSKESNYD